MVVPIDFQKVGANVQVIVIQRIEGQHLLLLRIQQPGLEKLQVPVGPIEDRRAGSTVLGRTGFAEVDRRTANVRDTLF